MNAKKDIFALLDTSGNLTLEAMQRYINGQLDPGEIKAVEEHLKTSPFDREALEGIKKQQSSDLQEVIAGLNENIHRAAREKASPIKRIPLHRSYYRAVAAVLVALIGITIVLVFMFRPPSNRELAVDSQQSVAGSQQSAVSSQQSEDRRQKTAVSSKGDITKDALSETGNRKQETIDYEPGAVGGIKMNEQDQVASVRPPTVKEIPEEIISPVPKPSPPVYQVDADRVAMQKGRIANNEENVFITVDSMPAFPGGEEALNHYLDSAITYPQLARESSIQGTVYATFIIEKDGTVTNVQVLRGIGGGCDEEAIRVLQSMPKWVPGMQSGQAVRVQYTLPVRFSL